MKMIVITVLLSCGLVYSVQSQDSDYTVYANDKSVIFADVVIRNAVNEESETYVIKEVIKHKGTENHFSVEVKYMTTANTTKSLFLSKAKISTISLNTGSSDCRTWKFTSSGNPCCNLIIRDGKDVLSSCQSDTEGCSMIATCIEKD